MNKFWLLISCLPFMSRLTIVACWFVLLLLDVSIFFVSSVSFQLIALTKVLWNNKGSSIFYNVNLNWRKVLLSLLIHLYRLSSFSFSYTLCYRKISCHFLCPQQRWRQSEGEGEELTTTTRRASLKCLKYVEK
jgi:hypothetical protein